MQCPRCQHENPPEQKFCGECGEPLAHNPGVRSALTESLEQQAATAEILAIISRSPADAQPVFDAIAVNALKLCDAHGAVVVRYDGELLHVVAHHNVNPEAVDRLKRRYPGAPGRNNPMGRAVLDRVVVQVPDLQVTEEFSGSVARQFGARGHVSIPLLDKDRAIGAIGISRPTLGPFSDRQIALLQTFAAQAVIAIENVRLFKELEARNRDLTEALEQQTATSDILRVISSSPTDVQPVFDAIAERAWRLCNATVVAVYRFDGDLIHFVAHHGFSPDALRVANQMWPAPPHRRNAAARSIADGTIVHLPDFTQDPEYRDRQYPGALHVRSVLSVPMLRDRRPIGAVTVGRVAPGAYSDREVELLQTFADQAVIAIENVRLFKELQEKNLALTHAHAQVTEALDRQTATAEILRVISSSPSEVQPVFEAIVESAARLCASRFAAFHRVEGQRIQLVAHRNLTPEVLTALQQVYPMPLGPETLTGRAILERTVIHIHDIYADPSVPPASRDIARVMDHGSIVYVPVLLEGRAIGTINVGRDTPFSDSEIALLQTFAAQAVIAIENVRLFTELQARNRDLTTALDKQTATSDILRVISQSQTDVQPVFDTIVASATRLCEADFSGLYQFDGTLLHFAAQHGRTPEEIEATRQVFPQSLGRASVPSRAILDASVVQVGDVREDPEIADVLRPLFRTVMAVPMMRDGRPLGTITVARRVVRPFSDEQIALLRTFADQAVIAIENVRLFNETKDALERQTATAEILRVISSSPTDVQPVFDAIVRSASRLCNGHWAMATRFDGELIHMVAQYNVHPDAPSLGALFPCPPSPRLPSSRAIVDGRLVHITDAEQDPDLAREVPRRARSFLAVPMLRKGAPIGSIAVSRPTPGPFPPNHIELLSTFAEQAVIAIENVRLFAELQEKNGALTESLEQQTATAEILRVISSSPTDVQPVFDAIAQSAVRLLGGYTGTLTRVVGDQLELEAFTSIDAAGAAAVRASYPRSIPSGGTHGLAIRDRAPANIADAETDPRVPENLRVPARVLGFRSFAAVPLLLHGEAIGTIGVSRREAGGFTDEEIALLQTFADQAVIAIENARLLTELQARTQELTRSVEQLTALGEVGRAVSSTLDLETVLTTIVSQAIQLSGTDGGSVYEYDESTEEFSLRASRDLPDAYVEQVRDVRPRKGEGAVGRVAQTREPVQIVDISDATAYESRVRHTLLQIGLRALLAVPLIAEDQLVGALIVMRKRTGSFADEEVALLQTFATQSALAIQNARLFREIEEKSRQLEVASQHKSEFLANMSHELRTPLNAIIGFSEVLSERMFGELNEKQEEYSKDIHASGQHLLSLINDILDLSKIEAGRMELELTDFDLPQAIDSALTLVRERAGRRGIALQMNVDSRLGQMRADERKVRQVVLNLLSNAIKFTPEGGRIEVIAAPRDRAVEISVSDTGVGIAPEDQEAVFEEFRQVGTADKKVEGTGLGLTLCRKFVELHGGRIWVKSQLGAGSTFTFTIPVRHGE